MVLLLSSPPGPILERPVSEDGQKNYGKEEDC